MKKIFPIAAFLLVSSAAMAQDTLWSIENCIRYAIENNIQVKQSQTDVEVSKLGVAQAKMAYVPTLSASAGFNANWGRALDPTTYSFVDNQTVSNMNVGATLGTTVFKGMAKMHQLKKSELNLQSTLMTSAQLKNEITIAIASAYLQVLYNKEEIRNSAQQIGSLEEQVARTKKLVDAGSVALGNLLELESQLAAERYKKVSVESNLKNSVLNLTQLLEFKTTAGFDIVEPRIDTITTAMLPDLLHTNENAQSLPQVELAKLSEKIASRDLSIAKSQMYPTLNFGLNYGSSWSDARQRPVLQNGQVSYAGYPFFAQLGDNAATTMQLSLSIPIFNGLNAQRGIRMAKWQRTKAELGITLAQNRLFKEIQQAHTDAQSALERYQSARTALVSSEQSFDYASKKFQAGAVTSVDYTTAKNNLIVAQSMVTQAKYQFIFKVKILDFYSGKPITL